VDVILLVRQIEYLNSEHGILLLDHGRHSGITLHCTLHMQTYTKSSGFSASHTWVTTHMAQDSTQIFQACFKMIVSWKVSWTVMCLKWKVLVKFIALTTNS